MADLPPMKPLAPESRATAAEQPLPVDTPGAAPASGKDMAIGAGAMLVLAILFFIMRGAYANYLVGNLKRSPNNAGLAGSALFGFLFFGAAVGCIALANTSFLTLAVIVPLVALSGICLLLCMIVSSKR